MWARFDLTEIRVGYEFLCEVLVVTRTIISMWFALLFGFTVDFGGYCERTVNMQMLKNTLQV